MTPRRPETRLRYLLTPREEVGRPDLEVLSVYRDHGVIPKTSRDDNFNKTPTDLSRYQVVRRGDLVVNKMKAWQGSVAVSRYEGIVSPDYLVCAVSPNVNSSYLHFLLRSTPLINEFRMRSKGIRPAQWRLYWDDLKGIRVRLPDAQLQISVADYLVAETVRIDALMESWVTLRSLLLERREIGVIVEVLGIGQEDRRHSRLPWVDTLPGSWQEVRLGLVARMGSGHTPSRTRPEWWTGCTIPWITTGEVGQVRDDRREVITETREWISELGLANSAAELHPAGTVVLCRTASAGYSAVMGANMATSQDFVTWTCGPRLSPYYLLWCLRAMRQDLLGRLAMGSTHKTIYVPDLQMLRIPLPPIPEQSQIVERIRAQNARIDRLVDAVAHQLSLLQERKQALVTAAVTGEIDVTTARGVEVS